MPSESTSVSEPPLRSRKALDAYLANHASAHTPLDRLSPLARDRFMESLAFGRSGLAGFSTAELAYELSQDEVVQVLTLFGVEKYADMIESRIPAGSRIRASLVAAGPIEIGFDRLYRLHQAGSTDELRRALEALMNGVEALQGGMDAMNDRELLYLLRSVEMVSFDAALTYDATRLHDIVALMSHRNMARTQDFKLVHAKLLETRQFDAAAAYARAHPDAIPTPPQLVDTLGAQAPAMTVWRASINGKSLHRSTVDLTGTQIVVTAGCHFSRDAAEDISKDPVLAPVFAEHARWLMLPPGKEDLTAVHAWNRDFPAAPAQLIYDRVEWTLLPKGWRMPTFLIVRDGKIITQINGWPRGDLQHRQRLIDRLAGAGLIDAGSL